MLIIDSLAYTNKFSNSNPFVKVLFSLAVIVLSIANSNIYFALVMIALVIILTLVGAQIPTSAYVKMLLAPLVFLFISILTIIFSFGFSKVAVSNFVFVKQFDFLNFYFGIPLGAFEKGIILTLRAISAIVGMYFLILTTPINQQIRVMKKFRLPSMFIELYVLTYRFITIFFEEAREIHMAQKIKFGYDGYSNSMNSLAILIKTLFVRVMQRYREMEAVLEIKFFDGNFYTEEG